MRDPNWMLDRLHTETRVHHSAADAGRQALLGTKLDRARYTDYLAKLFAFEAPIEMRWQRTPGISRLAALTPAIVTPLLEEDLARLSRFIDVVPAAPFRSPAQALGWMYVVERGRLLNSMLYRHLAKVLPTETQIAGRYLAASGSLGARWDALAGALDIVGRDAASATQIVNGALEAFRTLRHTSPNDRSHSPAKAA